MRYVKRLFLMGFASLVVFASTGALAATATMARTFKSGTVYATGTDALGGFTTAYRDFEKGAFHGGNTPRILSIAYTWSPYTNGRIQEKVELCYRPWNGTDLTNCTDITFSQNYNDITAFNKIDFKYGTGFYIRHTLYGGTYPAFRPEAGDSLTITHSH